MINLNNFHISIISPKDILKLASKYILNILHVGEVYVPETVNYKTGYPVQGGLFCEKIFGPIFNWKCKCHTVRQKYKHICTLCGTEVNNSYIRRFRMGVIYLHTPIYHPWYINSKTSILPVLLETTYENFKNLIYYKYCKIFTINNQTLIFNNSITNLKQLIYINYFIQKYLHNLNLLEQICNTKELILINKQNFNNLLYKKIFFLNLFFINKLNLSWLLLNNFPILPPDLRPIIKLNQYSFIVSTLNNLYKNILIYNNRLKIFSILKTKSPLNFIINTKLNLQTSIDLFFNKTVYNKKINNLLIKSLSGKYGKFRQNLLGKRVDYSGRSVITSGSDILFSKVGIPISIACNLFTPLLIYVLRKYKTIKYILFNTDYIHMSIFYRKLLTRIFKKTSILLNRAPTLHRINIQGFKPYLIEGNSIKLYPLVCSSFNADFDGDQMSVLLTLTKPSRLESKYIISSDKNFLSISTGLNLFKLNQIFLLGLYFISTLYYKISKGYCIYFNTLEDLIDYYLMKFIELHTLVWVKIIFINIKYNFKHNYFNFSSTGRLILSKALYYI